MGRSMQGTICQLVCDADTQVNFARLVSDLDAVLGRFASCPVSMTWDCEDIALFDMPGTRILMAWNERIGLDHLSCLTISVGPSPMSRTPGQFPAHDAMCVQLVERVQRRIPHLAAIWHHIPGIATSETIDELVDALPRLTTPDVSQYLEEESPEELEANDLVAMATLGLTVDDMSLAKRNAARDMPRWHDPDLGRLRHALYPPEEVAEKAKAPSSQMRLAAHAMNATILTLNAPIGAAVMAYGLFTGGDVRFSGRVMTLAGVAGVVANTSIGTSLMAFAGT